MQTWQLRLIGLGLPCLLAMSLDIGLTLNGQPPEYWAGSYTQTTEGGPFWRMLYVRHPAVAISGNLLWACLVGSLLVLLPEMLAVILAIAVVFGHTAGAYTWIQSALYTTSGPASSAWYQAAHALFLLAAAEAGVGVRWTVRSSARNERPEPRRLPGWLRWCLIVVIFGTGAAIVFVPW